MCLFSCLFKDSTKYLLFLIWIPFIIFFFKSGTVGTWDLNKREILMLKCLKLMLKIKVFFLTPPKEGGIFFSFFFIFTALLLHLWLWVQCQWYSRWPVTWAGGQVIACNVHSCLSHGWQLASWYLQKFSYIFKWGL